MDFRIGSPVSETRPAGIVIRIEPRIVFSVGPQFWSCHLALPHTGQLWGQVSGWTGRPPSSVREDIRIYNWRHFALTLGGEELTFFWLSPGPC